MPTFSCSVLIISIHLEFFKIRTKFTMEVFQEQTLIFKYCGIERFSSPLTKYFLFVVKMWNFIIMFYCVSTAVAFAFGTRDIREIAESMAPGFTGFVMFIKYAIFCFQTEDIFKIMDDLNSLNEYCKKFKFLKVSNFQNK